jgi:hypothetical protein
MKRRPITYTAAELAWIKAHCTDDRREAHEKFCREFARANVSIDNFNALCKRNGWLTGRTGHYAKGSVPQNKGKKMPYNANSARTQFKKGQRPHNTKYAGHEYQHEDGYIYISINETNPHTGFERRYVLKHKYLWQKKNGPVPEGMCLKCLDGDRTNCDPSNWELIPRGALPLINGRWEPGYDDAEPEVRPAVLTLAKLKHVRKTKIRALKEGKTE